MPKGLVIAGKLLIAQSYAGHKRAKLSLVQGSHCDHHWISSLFQMASLLCTAMQTELGLIPVHSRGAGYVAQAMQADLMGRTIQLAPLATLYN